MDRIDDVCCCLTAIPLYRVNIALPKQIDTESDHLNKFVYSFPTTYVFPFIFIVAAPSVGCCCCFGQFAENHLPFTLYVVQVLVVSSRVRPSTVFIGVPFAAVSPTSSSMAVQVFTLRCLVLYSSNWCMCVSKSMALLDEAG